MKISQKQAELLATEVINQLKRQRVGKVSEITRSKLQVFKDRRAELVKIKDEAAAELNRHDATLRSITGPLKHSSGYDTIAYIIEQMETATFPTAQQITDKIILKSMFSTEDDMTAFVAGIVKEFTKRKKVDA